MGPVYKYGTLSSLASLEAALVSAKPDVVIPCDDRVVWQLHELHARRPQLRPLIEASLGPASEFGIVAHRERLLETAQALGIRIPETRHLASVDDVRAWFQGGATRAVLKRDGTWGGDGVQIAHSEAEAVEAYLRLSRRPGLSTPAKRYLVNRDPLAWWAWRTRAVAPITIQAFVNGRPENAMLACWRGELLGLVVVQVLSSQGETGAGVVVRLVESEEIAEGARKLVGRLGLTGFYGLDFMIERDSQAAYLIEMNPRCTQLGHLALPKQGDLAGLFCAKLNGTRTIDPATPGDLALVAQPQPPIQNEVVAFFPQALVSHPRSSFAHGAHLDVPWEHPGLVHELMRPSFPDRQWMARLYHLFRAPRKVAAVEFVAAPRAARTAGVPAATNTATAEATTATVAAPFARSEVATPSASSTGAKTPTPPEGAPAAPSSGARGEARADPLVALVGAAKARRRM